MGASAGWLPESAEPEKITRESASRAKGPNFKLEKEREEKEKKEQEKRERWRQIALELVSQGYLDPRPHSASSCRSRESTVTFNVSPSYRLKTFRLRFIADVDVPNSDVRSAKKNTEPEANSQPPVTTTDKPEEAEEADEGNLENADANATDVRETHHSNGTLPQNEEPVGTPEPAPAVGPENRLFWTLEGLFFDVSAASGAFEELATRSSKAFEDEASEGSFLYDARVVRHCVLEDVVASVESYQYPFDLLVQIVDVIHGRNEALRRSHERRERKEETKKWMKENSISRGHVRTADAVRWYPPFGLSVGTRVGGLADRQEAGGRASEGAPSEISKGPRGPFVAFVASCGRCDYPAALKSRNLSQRNRQEATNLCRKERQGKLVILAQANASEPPNVRKLAANSRRDFYDYLGSPEQREQRCYSSKVSSKGISEACSVPFASLRTRLQFPDFRKQGTYPAIHTLWGKPISSEMEELHENALREVFTYFTSHEFYLGFDKMVNLYSSSLARMQSETAKKPAPGREKPNSEDENRRIKSRAPELSVVGKIYDDGQCELHMAGNKHPLNPNKVSSKKEETDDSSQGRNRSSLSDEKHTPIYAVPSSFCTAMRQRVCAFYDKLDYLDFGNAGLEVGLDPEQERNFLESVLKGQMEAQGLVSGGSFVSFGELYEISEKTERVGMELVPDRGCPFSLPEFKITLRIKYTEVIEVTPSWGD